MARVSSVWRAVRRTVSGLGGVGAAAWAVRARRKAAAGWGLGMKRFPGVRGLTFFYCEFTGSGVSDFSGGWTLQGDVGSGWSQRGTKCG